MKPIPFPQGQGWDEEVISVLKRLGSFKAEYPSELLAARRAAFVRQAGQVKNRVGANVVTDESFLQYLENLKSISMEYPLALRAARRAAFIDQIKQFNKVVVAEELSSEDQEIIQLIGNVKSVEVEHSYPPALMAARRAAFRRQVELGGGVSVLEALETFVRNLFQRRIKTFPMPAMNVLRTSLVVMILLLAVFVGSLVGNPIQSLKPAPSQVEVAQPGSISVATSTIEVAKVICKPGYLPPLCLAQEFDKSQDLTFQGNGSARPAVAKDAFAGYNGIHKPANVNDGFYGPGTTWISDSPYSWVKIDLGKSTTINTVAFGRDRLGRFIDHNPGQFVIAVALSDNVYADGNSSNDNLEYTEVFDSQQAGFSGVISGSQTIQAHFGPVAARYIKITFANKGTAIDEVEAFMKPPIVTNGSTRVPKEGPPGVFPTSVPTNTSIPTNTALPAPTDTPVPADTVTPVPTNTPLPTDTAVPIPTDTPLPLPTDTAVPAPTDTPAPADTPVPSVPTDTSIPVQVNLPQPTNTSAPPATFIEPVSAPTDTPIPAQP